MIFISVLLLYHLLIIQKFETTHEHLKKVYSSFLNPFSKGSFVRNFYERLWRQRMKVSFVRQLIEAEARNKETSLSSYSNV